MIRPFISRRGMQMLAGLATGILLSVLATAAVLHAFGVFESARLRGLERQLHAAAAQSGDSLAIATGPIEPGLEGVFVLDSVSGDLTCGVLNPRTGSVAGIFRRNVAADLGAEQGKLAKYLMVTGNLDTKGQVGNTRPAQSLVYVADANTGRYAGYMLPWNMQALNQNLPQVQALQLIGKGSARNVALE